VIATASATAAIELASSGLATNPALHAAIVAPLILIGLIAYIVRRRRNLNRNVDDGADQYVAGPSTDGPTDREGRA
jgi:hypothetical protein